ncbi:MAG: hypothetical protein QM756_05950 [Polyangiaceae bacterium]
MKSELLLLAAYAATACGGQNANSSAAAHGGRFGSGGTASGGSVPSNGSGGTSTGATSTGGAMNGGTSTGGNGGAPLGGASQGGSPTLSGGAGSNSGVSSGGTSSAGGALGGGAASSGGASPSGGSPSGGSPSGGSPSGGSASGGAATAGKSGTGGSCTNPPTPVAFPGAEGFGKNTLGGRLGDVYHVTSLADSGAGSLREGVTTASGPRTIVFELSGTIALASDLRIQAKSKLTIAGQTAPGDGITLRNHALFVDASQHIVVRYLRMRLGDTAGVESDAASVTNSSNIIFDHCSLSWSVDSVFDLTKYTGLATVQWSIMSEALMNSVHSKGPHSMAVGWDGKGAGGSSYHHNLLASCNSRMPRVDGIDPAGNPGPLVDMRNNVIYNWGSGLAYGGEFANMNFIANYLKPGPSSTNLGWLFEVSGAAGRIYVSGNYVDGQSGISSNNASGVNQGVVSQVFSVVSMPTDTAAAAYDSVLALVGASKVRDSVDTRIINDVRNRTGKNH